MEENINNEIKPNEKQNKKDVKKWIIVVLVLLVLVLAGILVYDKFIAEKDNGNVSIKDNNTNSNTNNNTVEKDETNNTVENNTTDFEDTEDSIKNLKRINLDENNILPIYKDVTSTSISKLGFNDKVEFVIKNAKLYMKSSGREEVINISNPKKVVICSYEMDGTNQICVLTTDNNVYSAHFSYEDESTDKFTDALNNLNSSIEKIDDLNSITDISVIETYPLIEIEWFTTYLVYEKNGNKYVYNISEDNDRNSPLSDLTYDLGEYEVKQDKTVYINGNKSNLSIKRDLYFGSQEDQHVFIDSDNMLYVYNPNVSKKTSTEGKIVAAYADADNLNQALYVRFADGSLKSIEDLLNK